MRPISTLRVMPVCVALSLAMAPGAARPQQPPPEPTASAEATAAATEPASGSQGRTLNGHAFMPAVDVPWAFTVTSFTSQLLLAYGKTTATATIQNQSFSGSMEYAGVGGFLGYEYAFLDHFSVRAFLNDAIYSGIDGRSVLTVGTQAQFGFGAGATASLRLGDSAQVGVLFDVSHQPSLGLTVLQGLRSVVDSCQQPSGCHVDVDQIFGTKAAVRIQPALAANWAPFRSLGFTANLAYQHVTSTGSASFSADAINPAAAVDFDLDAISSLPIGLQLQVSWIAPFSGTGLQHVTDFGGGIFYTGRKDLSAGLQILSRRFAVSPEVQVSWDTFITVAGLRYYWQ